VSFGSAGKDFKLLSVEPNLKGQIVKIEVLGKIYETLLPVIGEFQAWNALCALALVVACDGHAEKAVAAIPKLTGVPGRLQYIGQSDRGGTVFVDYAHKPDALENVLRAVRPHAAAHKGKVGIIFGCGGNRDKGKRPIMGAIAQKQADWVIVTDDNPRNEDASVIRREVLAGCLASPDIQEIGDRAQAIAAGIGRLSQNDILVIAGKGHEPGQIVGDKVLPFDDSEEARKVLGL
jgi:UDP-N-acetylmuramoyl-L-alanyl-D-glutamate--2,6-diaminopimelate ligase